MGFGAAEIALGGLGLVRRAIFRCRIPFAHPRARQSQTAKRLPSAFLSPYRVVSPRHFGEPSSNLPRTFIYGRERRELA